MAPWEHDEAEETQILDEALDAHHGQIDMLMQAVRGELTVGTIRYSIFEAVSYTHLDVYKRQDFFVRKPVFRRLIDRRG